MRSLALVLGLSLAGCKAAPAHELEGTPMASATGRIVVEPRQHLLPTYPCSSCHATLTANPKRRPLERFHQTRYEELAHGDDEFWCYQCHALENIDKLELANGKLVTFDEAPALCTSCHGDKVSDWKLGIHGLASGEMNGTKWRRSCTACHNPHDPKFQSMQPEKPPAPVQPKH